MIGFLAVDFTCQYLITVVFGFRLEPIFDDCLQKMTLTSKVVKNDSKNTHLDLLV